jgi:DNA-binding transcriptional LysR family regulator
MALANVHYLELFLLVVKHGSFSAAADALDISQPAVSIQIGRLEAALGVKLFERLGRGLHLTAEGEVVAEHAERLSMALAELENDVAKLKGAAKGRLVVAGNTAPGVKILPRAIAEFKKLYPSAEILLKVGSREQVEQWLLQNEIDVGVILGHPKTARLRKERLCDEQRVLVLPPKHPLTKKPRIVLADIAGQRMLLPDSGDLKFIIDKIFSEKGVVLEHTMFGNHEAIIAAVNCGLGMSILSHATVESHARSKSVAIRTIEGINLRSPVHILLHKQKHLSGLGRAFVAQLRDLVG